MHKNTPNSSSIEIIQPENEGKELLEIVAKVATEDRCFRNRWEAQSAASVSIIGSGANFAASAP